MSATDTTLRRDQPQMTGSGDAAGPGGDTQVDRELLLVAIVVVLGVIMTILDTTVVNVAIPTLAKTFDTTLPTIQWVATGYTLALATVIPLSGWIADRFGTKRLYTMSIVLFMFGSVLSGLAWSATSIIVFRVIQGLGGGMILPAGMTILTRAAGPHRIGRVMSIMGVPILIGPVLGPILGGWLTADVSWHWIFFINVPVGIVAVALAMRILPRDVAAHEQKFDLLGLCLLSPGLAIMIYGLAKSNPGGFGQATVLTPVVVGVLLLIGFVFHALRTSDPLVDLRLFLDRTFATSSITLLLVVISVFGSFLLLPLYFQAVRGTTPLQSGLLLAPQGLGSMVTMPIAGRLSDRTGPGRIVPFGLILVALAVLALTQIGANTSYVLLEAILFVFGLGMGFAMMPVFTGAMQSMREAMVARASTALNIIQQAGASIGTAVLSVVLATAISSQLGPAAKGGIGATIGLSDAARAKIAAPMAAAFGHTFWWATALLVIALIGSLALPRSKPELARAASPAATVT